MAHEDPADSGEYGEPPKKTKKKSMKLGGGGRFRACVRANQDKESPEGFCAAKGRAEYGKAGFQALSEHGTAGAAKARAGARARKSARDYYD